MPALWPALGRQPLRARRSARVRWDWGLTPALEKSYVQDWRCVKWARLALKVRLQASFRATIMCINASDGVIVDTLAINCLFG